MIKSVVFCSLDSFKNHVKANVNTIAISILDDSEWQAAKHLPVGFAGHVKLCFVDVYEELLNNPSGLTEFSKLNQVSFPDLHENYKAGARLFHEGNELCDLNDANKIVGFLNHYVFKDDEFDLVVHCYAGISRSSAVAQFVAEKYGVPIASANPDTSFANKRLLRLLNKSTENKALQNMTATSTPQSISQGLRKLG